MNGFPVTYGVRHQRLRYGRSWSEVSGFSPKSPCKKDIIHTVRLRLFVLNKDVVQFRNSISNIWNILILFRKLLYEWCAIIELPSFNLVIAIASYGDGIVTFARLGWFRMTMINLIMRKNKLAIHLSMKI